MALYVLPITFFIINSITINFTRTRQRSKIRIANA